MPTQKEYNLTKQKNRKLYAKILLLNHNMQKVDEWNNVVVGNPTFSISAESDIRRTCSISLIPIDKSFDIVYGGKIWVDKYIQIYIGIEDSKDKSVEYTNMGIYLLENPSKTYDAVNNTITISGVDLMAKMTGLRNGNLEGLAHYIPQGSNIRNAMIETIKLCGFDKYAIDEFPIDTPNDINIDIGGTAYGILSELLNIVSNRQMYFDVDGVFHCDQIPSGKDEQVMVTDDIWDKVLVGYNQSYDFDSIKNVIEVYGKTHDVGSNFGTTTLSGSTYTLNIANITELLDYMEFGFVVDDYTQNPYIKLNNWGAKPLKDEYGNFADLSKAQEEETYFVATYQEEGDYFLFLGEVTAYAMIKEENPESPFYINGTMGEVRIVLSGDEYENIYMDTLAKERAKWELYKRCRLQDSITINCVPIFWLDVNWLIEITLPNKNGTTVTNQYLIKDISTDISVSGTQSITLMRYYSFLE